MALFQTVHTLGYSLKEGEDRHQPIFQGLRHQFLANALAVKAARAIISDAKISNVICYLPTSTNP